MSAYLLRRLLYAVPVLMGVNLLSFALFFMVNTPDDMARMHLGAKYEDRQELDAWKQQRGYHLPLFWNSEAQGLERLRDTIFYRKSVPLFRFEFGSSDAGRDIAYDISQRMWPSIYYAVPVLLLGLFCSISIALCVVLFRATYIDLGAVTLCVVLMSISSLFYIIGGQYLVGKMLRLVPVSGYGGVLQPWKFLVLPVLISVAHGLGSGVRWYRTLFLEEAERDYVRTARAKGLRERTVLYGHVLRNALIPILTGVVVILPLLFLGSLITESFFSIPGLGSYTIEGIRRQDFAIVRAMVFLGAVLYIVGLLLTDIAYTLVDPRVRFN